MLNKLKNKMGRVVPQLPPEEHDLNKRVEGFQQELIPLLAKYELGLSAQPLISPDGRIGAQPVIVSARKKPEVKETDAQNAVVGDTTLVTPE